MAIRVVARDHFKPECVDKVLPLIKEMVELTRQEEGNISYQFYQDAQNPEFYAMIECWESEEILAKHMQSEHFKRIIPQMMEMTAEPSRLEVYREIY